MQPDPAIPEEAEGVLNYYGMADQRIGIARLQVPATLP
jgi:hypothetical protein